MEKIIQGIRGRAKSNPKKIVFPEPNDERILKAVEYIKKKR